MSGRLTKELFIGMHNASLEDRWPVVYRVVGTPEAIEARITSLGHKQKPAWCFEYRRVLEGAPYKKGEQTYKTSDEALEAFEQWLISHENET